MKNIITLTFLLFFGTCQSQLWIYNDSLNTTGGNVLEDYDKGYLVNGFCWPGYLNSIGLFMKIDYNGNRLWTKYFKGEDNWVALSNFIVLTTGGSVHIGDIDYTSGKSSGYVLVLKINACGEKEWCKRYSPNANGVDIALTPDGGYMALIKGEDYSVWLFRLDSSGEIIWQQQFLSDTSIFRYPNPGPLLRTSDSCYFINGTSITPDSLFPPGLYKIFTVKSDLNGNSIFEESWRYNDGLNWKSTSSVEDNNKTYFVNGALSEKPAIFHVTSEGKKDYYKELDNNNQNGICYRLNRFQDSSMVMCAEYQYAAYNDTVGIIKTNSTGDFLKARGIFGTIPGTMLSGATVTSDNKFVATGSVQYDAFVIKTNSDLEYDSINTTPFTYDSLCPHAITTDTITLNDCDLISSVFDPVIDEKNHFLTVFPNPSSESINLNMPEYLMRQNKGRWVSSKTYYRKWDKTKLLICDLSGKLVYSNEIPQEIKTLKINIGSWPAGLYVARLLYLNDAVGSGKFIITK